MVHHQDTTNNTTRAREQVERFVRRFEPSYRWLACHAALPLVLTPELVNYLRMQFLKSEGVPWIAEADLLLSDLCRQVGYELYVMDGTVRAYLLKQLKDEFGEERIEAVARLLVSYVKHLARTNPFVGQKELQAQRWAAMVYLDDSRDIAVRELVEALQASVTSSDRLEMLRLQKLTEELKPQLLQYESLRNLSVVFSKILTNSPEIDSKELIQTYQILPGLKFKFPDEFIRHQIPLKSFTFETVTVNRSGVIIKRENKTAQYYTEDLSNDVTLDMVAIPGGTFTMGSSEDEKGRDGDESPQHQVSVPPFFMGKYPVTQKQWRAIASLKKVERDLKLDPSYFKGDDRPVEQVAWYDAVEFCARLSKVTGRSYRLPSEAEWEYACRAGTTTPFYFGETITGELANYRASNTYADELPGEYRKNTTPVGQFPPNAFGLHDMHGNVWEWCLDPWHDNYEDAPGDESVWDESNRNDNHYQNISENLEVFLKDNRRRILRGGSWVGNPRLCRSAYRFDYYPRDDYHDSGFRVVCGVPRT
ncbi:MAG: formylglycine-generating enzyme family protein [Xenococcaceae cyanobacterium]